MGGDFAHRDERVQQAVKSIHAFVIAFISLYERSFAMKTSARFSFCNTLRSAQAKGNGGSARQRGGEKH